MKTSLLGILLMVIATIGPLAFGQSIQSAWNYSYDESDVGKQISFFTPINSGSDGSVAFVVTRSDGGGGNLENQVFWVRANDDGSSPSDALWKSGWIASSGFIDVVAVRKNHLVYSSGRQLRSVTIDSVGTATATTVKTFSGTEEGGDPLVFTVEMARAPGFVYAIAAQEDKQGFTLSAFQFTPAIPQVSEVATITSVSGNALSISFRGELGINYQVQSSATLEADTWQNMGGVIAGNGTIQTYSQAITLPKLFYRIVAM